MSVAYNPRTITSGLKHYLDAGNLKSYIGPDVRFGSDSLIWGADTPQFLSTNWLNVLDINQRATLTNITPTPSALVFSGTNSYATITSGYRPTSWADAWTIEVWIYIPTAAVWNTTYYSGIVTLGTYSGSLGVAQTNVNNTVCVWIRDDTISNNATTTIVRDTWNNITVTWTGANAYIYKNGVQSNTFAKTCNGVPEIDNWRIGGGIALSGATGSYLNGSISSLKIYNRALSATEVFQNFAALRGRHSI
jgi:hypothetical protein